MARSKRKGGGDVERERDAKANAGDARQEADVNATSRELPDVNTLVDCSHFAVACLTVVNFMVTGAGGVFLGMLVFTPRIHRFAYLVLGLTLASAMAAILACLRYMYQRIHVGPQEKWVGMIAGVALIYLFVIAQVFLLDNFWPWPYVYPESSWWFVLGLAVIFGGAGLVYRVQLQRVIESVSKLMGLLVQRLPQSEDQQ